MMDGLQIVALAVIQGIAEFLPISSSGHVVVASKLFGDRPDLVDVNIVLHLGTLGSIVAYYWRPVAQMLTHHRRLLPLLVVGTIPAALFGLTLHRYYRFVLSDALLTGVAFVATGFLLLTLKTMKPGSGAYEELTWRQALGIGLFQAVAVLPGVSRSGATIVGGCRQGLRPAAAATFAFLLAIPAILGAGVVEALELAQTPVATPLGLLALGAAVSFAVGLASLALLVRLIDSGRLFGFAYYLIPLGLAVLAWQLAVESGWGGAVR